MKLFFSLFCLALTTTHSYSREPKSNNSLTAGMAITMIGGASKAYALSQRSGTTFYKLNARDPLKNQADLKKLIINYSQENGDQVKIFGYNLDGGRAEYKMKGVPVSELKLKATKFPNAHVTLRGGIPKKFQKLCDHGNILLVAGSAISLFSLFETTDQIFDFMEINKSLGQASQQKIN